MEVRPGYKRTDVGVIPEDWDVDYLGEKTTKVGSGITPTGGRKVYKREGRPFLRSQNVGWGNLLLDDIAFIDDSTHETFRATEIETDDVFLNITGASIGRSAVADERVTGGNVNQHVCIIRTNRDQLHPHFLNLFLLSSTGQRQIDSFQAGGNRQGLNFGQIRSIQIPLPPLPEQRAIAEVLSDVDASIAALDRLIAKKRAIKQGAMQRLLTGQTRLPGFPKAQAQYKQTEVGVIPDDWKTKTLEELCIPGGLVRGPFGGAIKKEFFVKDGYKVYEQRNAIYGDADLGSYFIDENKYRELRRFEVREGDFIVSCSGTIGRIFQIPKDARAGVINQALLKIKTDDCVVHDKFFFYVFDWNRFQQRIIDNTQGGAMHNLVGMDVFRNTLIPTPPLPEQRAIAAVLSDVDAEIAALEARRDKTHALKQGLMQELLTGRTRLV